jgi:hypothetical protein
MIHGRFAGLELRGEEQIKAFKGLNELSNSDQRSHRRDFARGGSIPDDVLWTNSSGKSRAIPNLARVGRVTSIREIAFLLDEGNVIIGPGFPCFRPSSAANLSCLV